LLPGKQRNNILHLKERGGINEITKHDFLLLGVDEKACAEKLSFSFSFVLHAGLSESGMYRNFRDFALHVHVHVHMGYYMPWQMYREIFNISRCIAK
jgi:hypothetical protein